MKDINIIIIGARNYNSATYDNNDYTTWNNYYQAPYDKLYQFKKKLEDKNYTVNIFCFDGTYPIAINSEIGDISYINNYFNLGNTAYVNKNFHNIFIEFANLLSEYFTTVLNNNNTQYEDIMKYKDYKISWVSCGCCWNKGFPDKLLDYIIYNEYFTPVDACSADSFISAIGITQHIADNNITHIMSPFSQGIYQILGSLVWRGDSQNYSPEYVLHDLLTLLNDDVIKYLPYYDDVQKFINKEIHWNMLNRETRLSYTYYIFGNNIEIV
jgi:hypothetical protein